jgi:hypothetical protein
MRQDRGQAGLQVSPEGINLAVKLEICPWTREHRLQNRHLTQHPLDKYSHV